MADGARSSQAGREQLDLIEGEFRRYRALGRAAMEQLEDAWLGEAPPGQNSVATIAWHVAGNLRSRFTDFPAADGEKPWRDREGEFAPRHVGREELFGEWDAGWDTLFDALAPLRDAHLSGATSIRGVEMRVDQALLRSLAHAAYHVGQIVYVAKSLCGDGWRWLTIPPGGTAAYNANPTRERAHEAASRLQAERREGPGEERPPPAS